MTVYAMVDDLTAEELVAEIEVVDEEVRKAQKTVDFWKSQKVTLTAQLARALSPESGEVVMAPSGRMVFAEWGPDGDARVHAAAIEEIASRLPVGLRPRYETRYPTANDIRKAAKEGRLPKGVSADDLLIEPREVPKIRWQTPKEDGR